MIRIPLKKAGEYEYINTIAAFLRIPFDPQQGATFAEVMETAPLLIRAMEAEDYLEVTKDEYFLIMSRIQNGRFKEISPELYQMFTDLLELTPGIDGDGTPSDQGLNVVS